MMDGLLPSTQAEVELLSRQSGLSGRQVERWFRRRRNQDRPSLLKKFREARWGRLGEVGGAKSDVSCWEGWAMAVCRARCHAGEVSLVLHDIPEDLWGTWRVVPFSHPTVLAVSASFSSWRFTFYLIAFIAGMAVIVDVSGDY